MEPWTIGPPNFVMSPSRAAGLPPLIAKSFCKTSGFVTYACMERKNEELTQSGPDSEII
jgi:hypothetical protein